MYLLQETFPVKVFSRHIKDFRGNRSKSFPPQGGRKHPHQELLQIDTTNILFICGGAFDGLEKIVESRLGSGSIGFGAEIIGKDERSISELICCRCFHEEFGKFDYDLDVYRTSSCYGIA